MNKTQHTEVFYVEKSDEPMGSKMTRRISKLIERKPEILQTRPEWGKYKDSEEKMKQRGQETREYHKEEKPGAIHEDAQDPVKDPMNPIEMSKGADGQVASVAVIHKDKILMGKRRDNGRWTLPGGHLDSGEDPHEGGKRELKEEAGIEADKLKHLGTKKLTTHSGKDKTIHAFKYEVSKKPTTSMKQDPDQEVEKWQWITTKDGKLPDHVKQNLHSPKNVVLELSGLNKAEKKKDKVKYGGGEVDRDVFYAFRDKPKEETIDKARFFVADIIKGRPHKYIRKYKGRTGEWIYIYHEGDQHHKLAEEDIQAHKHLAEHGDEHERAHHAELVARIEEMKQEHIDDHKLLAEHGEEHERAHHQSILRHLGYKKDEEEAPHKLDTLEATVTQAENQDEIDHDLPAEKRSKAIEAVKRELEASTAHLGGYAETPVGRAVLPTLRDRHATRGLTVELDKAKTVREVLDALGKIAHKLDLAQGDNSASRPGDHKTYGNLIYNKGLESLVRAEIIPQEYADEHKREARTGMPEHKDMRGIRERAEARQREEADRERREMAELDGSMAAHMVSLMEGMTGPRKVQKAREMDAALRQIFGHSPRKEDWPYNFESEGLKTKIQSVNAHGSSLELNMQVYDAEGNPIMESWSRRWEKQGGRPHIYNSYMKVKSSMRGTARVGDLINRGQRELMRRQPRGGTIGVTAALDVGGYNWANQGFSFSSENELRNYRQRFQYFLAEKGINLTNADMEAFKDPVHFAAFNNGKKYLKTLESPYKLTQEQISSGSLTGTPGSTEHRLTSSEISSGKSNRMLCHLGKLFLLGNSWRGTWDSKEVNATTRYADAYRQLRERAVKHLEPAYQQVTAAAQAGERGRPAPRSPEVRRDTATASQVNREYVDSTIRRWSPQSGLGRQNIRMTKVRINRMMRWPQADIQHFLSNAPITAGARRSIREALAARGGS